MEIITFTAMQMFLDQVKHVGCLRRFKRAVGWSHGNAAASLFYLALLIIICFKTGFLFAQGCEDVEELSSYESLNNRYTERPIDFNKQEMSDENRGVNPIDSCWQCRGTTAN